VARESAVTTNHVVTLICDKCKTETNEAICWAHLDIKAPDGYSVDLCSDCWLEVRDIIWGITTVDKPHLMRVVEFSITS
jgi:hypothetical protein